jgi:competence protein ComEC
VSRRRRVRERLAGAAQRVAAAPRAATKHRGAATRLAAATHRATATRLAPATHRAAAAVRRHPHLVALAALAGGLAAAPAGPVAVAALAAAGGAASALAGLRIAAALWLAFALAGGAAGALRVDAIDAPGRSVAAGDVVHARATLLERPRPAAFGGARAVVRLDTGRARGARLLAQPGEGVRWPRAAAPGTELALVGVVREPAARGPGERFDARAHLRRRGVAAELRLVELRATGRRRGGALGAVDRIRGRAEAGVAARLAPEPAALARGMVLGQDEAIAEAVRADFRDSGLGHLLAVSGQNVVLLCALALPALALLDLGPSARAGALLALIAVYVAVAGAAPPLQRAAAMGAAALVAFAAGRPSSRAFALAVAAVATLAANPRVAGDPGWQLSFAAVLGIAVVGRPLAAALAVAIAAARSDGRRPGRVLRGLLDGVAITVAATVATAPVAAYHFGSLPLAAVPANVAALPAVAPAMWLGMLRAGLGQLAAVPVAGAIAGVIAGALAPLSAMALGWIAAIAQHAPEATPPVAVALPAWGVAASFAALAVLAAAARRLAGRAGPGVAALGARWRLAPTGRRRAAGLAALAAALALGAAVVRGPGPPGSLEVSFLDVGQGDAVLVRDPSGAAVLFDGGPPEGRAARLVRRAGVRRLTAVVATHASRDHHGGLVEVLRRVPTALLLDGGDGSRDPGFRAVLAEAERRGVRRVPARAGLVLRAGGTAIEVISPPPRPPGPPPEDPNPRAVVAIVRSGAFELLLTADAESEAVVGLPLPDVDAMKVPHHGSADPGLPDLLRRARPEVAAIEVGAGNPYGHPTPSTLAALGRAVPHVHRTDEDGTITLTVEDGRMAIRTER